MDETLLTVNKPAYYPDLDKWVTTLEHKLDHILADYITSNADQSTIFQGKVSSFIYTLSQYWQRPDALAEEVEKELSGMLKQYFFRQEVTVTPQDEFEGSNKFNLKIEIKVSDGDNRSARSTRILFTEDSKFKRALTYNDKGIMTDDTTYIRYN